jgi:hypothetical protein
MRRYLIAEKIMHKQITSLISIAVLTGLIILCSCKDKKQSNTKIKTIDSIAMPAKYPKDHKLSSQERKDFSNKFLKRKGVPVLEHLPLIEDHTNARFRDEKEVARKAIVLYGLIYVAHGERTSKEIIAYFKKYNLWGSVSPDERKYLQNKTEKGNIAISWRIENLYVLYWALGNIDTLSFPTTICSFRDSNLPEPGIDPTEWIAGSKLRDKEEILNETDLIYRIHWATREADLNGKPMPAGLNDDIVMERHFALNWLTMYTDDWDEITTDT